MENKKKEWILMNKYEMGKVLGQGTFAKVYHGRALSAAGQSVAIKVIDKSRVLRTGMIDQVKREISVLRRVQHPNVVRLHEVMASKTKIYFVMEYVRGGELFDKLAMGRMKEDVARKYFQQLIGAVGFCHSRGVYHRDIKPENLLVGDDGELKLSDFGLSALWESRRQDGLLHSTCGTPAYVAPEVINKRGYDGAKVDIWSSGVVLFLLMAGYLPFHETNLMEMYRKISRGEFKCPYWFSTDAKKLLFRLLDPNPTTRISIAEIKENPWFKKGLQKPVEASKFYEHREEPNNVVTLADIHKALSDATGGGSNGQNPTPTKTNRVSLNAFDIISLSPGFDLSRLFQEESSSKRLEERFMKRKPVVLIN